jgi:hypothetical protein
MKLGNGILKTSIQELSDKTFHFYNSLVLTDEDNSCFTADETTATLHHGGDTFKCEYHPRTKIPTISCLPANTASIQHIPSTSIAQQPNHKGRKRLIFNENHQITTPAAYN